MNEFTKDMDEVLVKAIQAYGVKQQSEKIKEECLELALAIQRTTSHIKGNTYEDEIIDEIADVKIMIRQAERIWNKEKIDERVKFKIERLKHNLEDGNSNL